MESTDRVIISILKEMLVWTKVGMYSSVKDLILSEFLEAKPETKLAYELLDGHRSQSEIVEYCKKNIKDPKISNASLSRWTKSWENLGLLEKNGNTIKKNFSLLDFGFNDEFLKKI